MTHAQPRSFQTTRWSLVIAAGGTTNPQSREALEELCRIYWYPLYAFVRRGGCSPEDALDRTQGFFADLLHRKDFAGTSPDRGRFRSWLLGCLKHYLANVHARETAEKRGGKIAVVPLDGPGAEARYAREPADGLDPEKLYVRRWLLEILDRVLGELREERVRAGKGELFERLKPFIVHEGEESYAALAAELSMSVGALKVAIHRLRDSYQDRVHAEILRTVESPGDVAEELRLLLASLE